MDDSTGPAMRPTMRPSAVAGSEEPKRTGDSSKERERKLGPTLVAVSAIVLISTLIFIFTAERLIDPLQISSWLGSVRDQWWTPLAFAGCYVASALLLLPVTFLSIAAALIWGWKIGGAIELFVATFSALAPFTIARGFAPGWLHQRLSERFSGRGLKDDGITLLLLLRLVPVVPYVALNYMAGIAGFRFREFCLTTFFGMIPSVFVFAFFVDALSAGMISQQQVFVRILVAGGLLGALLIVVRILTPAVRARMRS